MIFFDEKEDVIDLQLTQYGKYLLSQGNFKPTYYAFFDDDIIYDQRYAEGSALEEQNEIEGRIFNDTPRSKTQYLFHSVDQLEELNELQRTNFTEYKEKIQQTPEKHYTTAAPLGNSYLFDNKAPAFDIKLLKGTISNSVTTISGTGDGVYSTQTIPQINLNDVIFYTSVKDADGSTGELDIETSFRDGTYIDVQEDFLLLTIKEENVPMAKENFDIEVYVTDQSGNIEFPLYFIKETPVVENGILVERGDVSLGDPNVFGSDSDVHENELSPGQIPSPGFYDVDQVRYFFQIRTDNNIGSSQAALLLNEEE